MKVLVANLGSTSFKHRLFDMSDERELARGGVERIGSDQARAYVVAGTGKHEQTQAVANHAIAMELCLNLLCDARLDCLETLEEIGAVGFKAVHGGKVSGVQRIDERVLAAMEEVADVAPAHNPPYVRAMRLLHRRFPGVALVAAFETAFHQTVPEANRCYAVPYHWAQKHSIRRWGFHGASHRYIATRMAELLGRQDGRIISCHLGGSSSLCAIHAGRSVATSMGMSPQSGLPQNNRAGDFDPFALPVLMRATGKSLDELLEELAEQSGLLGLSGLSGDVRDLEQAAAGGDTRARLALEVFIASVRHYLGAYLVQLGGADAIVFTGGIGENAASVRAAVCDSLQPLGISLDAQCNRQAIGETLVSDAESPIQIWTVPTNEEIIVARQVRELLEAGQ